MLIPLSDVNTINGTLTIVHFKGDKNQIVYLAEDVRRLCDNYQKWLMSRMPIQSEWFFPGKYPEKYIPKTSVDRKFNEFWNATEKSQSCDKKPTVHCLRHAFVIKQMNAWMENGINLWGMMPYLSNYLGHKGPMETCYYYHQVEESFKTLRRKDKISTSVIPEMSDE